MYLSVGYLLVELRVVTVDVDVFDCACGVLFRGNPLTGSHLVQMCPQPFLDSLHSLEPCPIVNLVRIIAPVEELLAAVTVIANVDVIAFGE
jgi:hypothetical protein